MDLQLEGRGALVTGASAGIGRAIAGSSRIASWRWRAKLSVNASCHCSSVASLPKARLPPALFTSTWTGPMPASAFATMPST